MRSRCVAETWDFSIEYLDKLLATKVLPEILCLLGFEVIS